MHIITLALIVSMGINLVMFVPAFIFKTDKLTDISYAVTFVAVIAAAYLRSGKGPLQTLLLACVCLWALRLGIFLFIRINKRGRDKRFDGMREHFFRFIRFWILQGLSVFVVLLASIVALDNAAQSLSWLAVTGALVFVVGLVLEAAADAQKFSFGNDSNNKGKWIETGVWRLSRHPNYLGEMLVWIGLYIVAATAIGSFTGKLVALLSPLYIVCLLRFVSGVPLLEKSADSRWGSDKDYLNYKRRVPRLIPTISSIKRACEA